MFNQKQTKNAQKICVFLLLNVFFSTKNIVNRFSFTTDWNRKSDNQEDFTFWQDGHTKIKKSSGKSRRPGNYA